MFDRLRTYVGNYLRYRQYSGNRNLFWPLLLSKGVVIEEGVTVQRFVELGEGTVLRKRSIVGAYAILSRIEIGEASHVEKGVVVTGHGNGQIHIGRESYIGINNVLDRSADISIGDYVHIAGPSTGLWTHSSVHQALSGHALNDKSKRETKPIRIEDCVYIGGNCTIYPGVTIGHHSVVAPNSAVADDVPPHTMVGGVPAKVIKHLDH